MNQQSHWAGIVAAVKNPLGFFSLALLVTMTGLTIVGTCSGMGAWQQFACFCIMTVLLLAVVAIVAFIVVRMPKHLYESIAHEVEESKKRRTFWDNPQDFREWMGFALRRHLKGDCFLLEAPKDEATGP